MSRLKPPLTATELRLLNCHICGLICRDCRGSDAACPRCGTLLHRRKPDSISRTWALLIAAALLYIPANVLPILYTSTLFGTQGNTILSGVVTLWTSGNWDLAVVVFVASIVVPLLKIGALSLLLMTVRNRPRWRRPERARLYRILEYIGHWSMLDVFVVTLLSAMVQFRHFAQARAGIGAVAFGAVVVLTMLASKSFEPRLIWDNARQRK